MKPQRIEFSGIHGKVVEYRFDEHNLISATKDGIIFSMVRENMPLEDAADVFNALNKAILQHINLRDTGEVLKESILELIVSRTTKMMTGTLKGLI